MTTQHTNEKIAPVQGYTPGIPWSLHLEAYEVYSRKWSPQPALIDLEGRNCRGGFSTGELDEFIPGWRDRASELVRVKAQRDELLEALKLARGALRQAATDVSDWGAYAPAHFQTKHKLADDVQAYNNAADSARAAIAKAEGSA